MSDRSGNCTLSYPGPQTVVASHMQLDWPGNAAIGSPLAQHFTLAPTAAHTAAQTEPMNIPTVEYVRALEPRLAYTEGLCHGYVSDLVAVLSRLHILEIANDLPGPSNGQPDAEPSTALFDSPADIANVENRVRLGMPRPPPSHRPAGSLLHRHPTRTLPAPSHPI